MRVGGVSPISVDVRVIAATNQPIRELVDERPFPRRSLLSTQRSADLSAAAARAPRRHSHARSPLHRDYSAQHDRKFHGISADAMQRLVEYPWPGNVRELRNLIESMVVLAPDHEIEPNDLPRQIREGGTGAVPARARRSDRARAGSATAGGRELEFIVRSLLELKLQVEELRESTSIGRPTRRMDRRSAAGRISASVTGAGASLPTSTPSSVGAIEPRDQPPPPNVVNITPGTTMAEIERAAIELALRESRGNRRRAADMLGIGERTLYRKIKEYRMPEQATYETE